MALHYLGSAGTGPGDMPGLHTERRSKINAFVPVTVTMADFGNDVIVVDPELLVWDSAYGPLSRPEGPF